MRILVAMVMLCVTALATAQGVQPLPDDPVANKRAVDLSQQLRCLVCQNQTIGDSNAELAADLRNQIRTQIAQGRTDKQIIDFMVDRYGDFVLYRPPVKGITLFLWFGPLVLLAIAFAGLLVYLRRRRDVTEHQELSADQRSKARVLLAGDEGADK